MKARRRRKREDPDWTACYLELAVGLRRQRHRGNWPFSEWWKLLRHTLTSRQARVVVLRAMHDMTFEEIGERFDRSRGWTNMVMREAGKKLPRELIGEMLAK